MPKCFSICHEKKIIVSMCNKTWSLVRNFLFTAVNTVYFYISSPYHTGNVWWDIFRNISDNLLTVCILTRILPICAWDSRIVLVKINSFKKAYWRLNTEIWGKLFLILHSIVYLVHKFREPWNAKKPLPAIRDRPVECINTTCSECIRFGFKWSL